MARRKKGTPVHGWLVLDKDLGDTSTHALAQVKRLFDAQKAGHAGTLDPLATGILPIAFGEATKTVPFAVDGEKAYRSSCAGAQRRRRTTPKATAREDQREAADARGFEALLPRSSARSCRCRRPFRRSRSEATGPTIWHVMAKKSCWSRAPSTSIRCESSTRPMPIPPCSRRSAARARTCARWLATWAACSAASATSSVCAALRSGRSTRTKPSPSRICALPPRKAGRRRCSVS